MSFIWAATGVKLYTAASVKALVGKENGKYSQVYKETSGINICL